MMTYIKNIWRAILAKPYEVQRIVEQKKLIYSKDPNGLLERDLAIIKKYAQSKPYKVGDPLELVAWKQGQQDIIYMIEHKMVAPRTTQLN